MKEMATLRSLSLILFVSLLVGCSRRAAECRGSAPSSPTCRASDAGASDADVTATEAEADLAPGDAVTHDAAPEVDTLDADARAPALLSPIRFHLRNDGPGDVYLGLRFLDRCAFDYTVTKLEPSDGGDDAGSSSVIIESPMCPCGVKCSDCATCSAVSCDELCDEDPPRIVPGQERILTWDGRRFDFVTVCTGIRCAAASLAAPGRYLLTVPVYDSAVQPTSGVAAARTANVSFDLGGASVEGTDVELSIRLP
jgi:hypothetical protein